MLHKHVQRDIANATVRILKKGGQGVLVGGGLILTAAHCIDFECKGGMALGDYFIEDIRTTKGKLKAAPLAVEPVSDIAVLGSLDQQVLFREAEKFENFCEKVKPISLCLDDFEPFKDFPVYIYTHRGKWVTARAHQSYKMANTLWIEAEDPIKDGTSGGPIINESGALVGIVSSFSIPKGRMKSNGPSPRPHLCLPVWTCSRILDSTINFRRQRP